MLQAAALSRHRLSSSPMPWTCCSLGVHALRACARARQAYAYAYAQGLRSGHAYAQGTRSDISSGAPLNSREPLAMHFYTDLPWGPGSVSSPSSSFKLEHRQQLTIVPRVTRPVGPSHLIIAPSIIYNFYASLTLTFLLQRLSRDYARDSHSIPNIGL